MRKEAEEFCEERFPEILDRISNQNKTRRGNCMRQVHDMQFDDEKIQSEEVSTPGAELIDVSY